VGLGAIIPAEAGAPALPDNAQGAKGAVLVATPATTAAASERTAPERAAPQGAEPPSSVARHAPARDFVSAGEIFRQTAAALNLPADSLTIALIAFSRFFSLPPSKALFAALRRDALGAAALSQMAANTAGETSTIEIEAQAMAAAAAFDKGVALSGEALERYARLLAPSVTENEENAQERQGGGESGNGAASGEGRGGNGENGGKNRNGREKAPEAEELSALAEEQSEKDSVEDFLNRIPGKNGQHWAVFPFTITVQGTELHIVARILKTAPFLSGGNGHLIADITAPQRHYRCVLKKNNEKLRADIQVCPPLSPQALDAAAKNAEGVLRGGAALAGEVSPLEFEEIHVRNADEPLSFVKDLSSECLLSIDETV